MQRAVSVFFVSLVLGGAWPGPAAATSITFTTDGSWLAKNTAPGAGWDTDPSFDTAADGGWIAASVNDVVGCPPSQGCIWYDGEFSTTEQVYLRRTFVLDGPAISGSLIGGVDDDARISINGNVVYNIFDGFASLFGPINIAPFLVPGSNLVAVFADDNLDFGFQHNFHAQLSIETANTVPEPASILLLASGLAGLAARRYLHAPKNDSRQKCVSAISRGTQGQGDSGIRTRELGGAGESTQNQSVWKRAKAQD